MRVDAKSVAILGEMRMCKCKLFAVRFQCHVILMSFYLFRASIYLFDLHFVNSNPHGEMQH